MRRSDPVSSIFDDQEMENLRHGRCLVSDGPCDPTVGRMLTENDSLDHRFRVELRDWYAIAKYRGCEEYFRERLRGTVNDLTAFEQIVGELMAGYFLYKHVDPNVEYCCATSGADFACILEGMPVKFEVKTAVRDNVPPAPYCGPVDELSPAIRSLIDKVRKQLGTDDTNVILVVNRCDKLDVQDVMNAMYGTLVLAGPIGGPFSEKRLRDGKCGPNQMTRIGAVGVIAQDVSGSIYAWFIHNRHAKNPVPQSPLDPWPQLVRTEDSRVLRWRNGRP